MLLFCCRRHVDNGTCPDYNSSFYLALSPSSSATLTSYNCTDSSESDDDNADDYQWVEDACLDNHLLFFSAGECETNVTLWLRQDHVFEGSERLLFHVTNCSNCVSNVTGDAPVVINIDDRLDCKF